MYHRAGAEGMGSRVAPCSVCESLAPTGVRCVSVNVQWKLWKILQRECMYDWRISCASDVISLTRAIRLRIHSMFS